MKYVFILFLGVALFSCKKKGCTDPFAVNYDSTAEKDKGCYYPNYTLCLLREDAEQYKNDGVIGFILKTKDGIASDAPAAFKNVNLFIDVNDYTIEFPGCGGGVWSYYEDKNYYYYGDVLNLYEVTTTDTVFNRSLVVAYTSLDPSGNPSQCKKDRIFYF